jgi:hypothetical protein
MNHLQHFYSLALGPLDLPDHQPPCLVEGGQSGLHVKSANGAHCRLGTRMGISVAIQQPLFNGTHGRREAEKPPTTLQDTRPKPIR